mmetsp:Transcript_30131/g.58995  ORF Transcript_30131/g.58995 Transcript_30131/m.58995 type:complete len:151 (+) Transcript_30131:44-496(+)
MVNLAVQLKADIQGFVSLRWQGNYNVAVTFPGGETNDNIWIDPEEEHEMPGSRGVANVLVKGGGKKPASISIIETKGEYKEGEGFSTFAKFDCRGLEISEWKISEGLIGVDENGKETTIELEDDGEFYDCAEDGSEISVTSIQTQVIKVK